MDERRAIALLVDSFEVDDQLARIMFGVRENLGSKEGDDVVRDDLAVFILEIRVVDT